MYHDIHIIKCIISAYIYIYICVCVLSRSIVSDSLHPHELQPVRFLCPWDFPGKNTEVSCHFLPQGIFPTQGSNHISCISCIGRWILYHWDVGSPYIYLYVLYITCNFIHVLYNTHIIIYVSFILYIIMYTILYISMCIIYQYIYLYILYIYYDMQYYYYTIQYIV